LILTTLWNTHHQNLMKILLSFSKKNYRRISQSASTAKVSQLPPKTENQSRRALRSRLAREQRISSRSSGSTFGRNSHSKFVNRLLMSLSIFLYILCIKCNNLYFFMDHNPENWLGVLIRHQNIFRFLHLSSNNGCAIRK